MSGLEGSKGSWETLKNKLNLTQFLLSSDIRSEGSIAIVKIFDFEFFLWFFILHHSQSLKMCFRKKCLCVCLWQSPNFAPKPIDRYCWNSISGVLCKYPGLLFLISPSPWIKNSPHKKRKIKILIFSKMASTILIKFYGFIVVSIPNNMILSVFRKIHETRKLFFNLLSVEKTLAYLI